MMIQSPPPNSINTVFSCAIENQRLNMDSLCDWSNCGGPWQKPHDNCDDCSLNKSKESLFTGEEQSKLSDTGIVGCSRTCFDSSAVNNMCASSASKKDGYVYKRRKLQSNAIALLSEENAAKTTERTSSYHSNEIFIEHSSLDVDVEGAPPVGSDGTNGNPSISGCHNLEQTSDVGNINLEPVQIALPSVGEDKVPVDMSLSNLQKASTEDYSSTNDSCSSSIYNLGHVSASMKAEVEEIGECSSSDMVVAEAPGKSSVKDLCISFLKSRGLLGEQWTTGACASLEVVGVTDVSCSQKCKICCRLENSLKMLICDLCDDAFHMSCCNPRVKMPPQDDEWFCLSCRRKKPKCVRKSCTGKSSKIAGSMSRSEVGPILSMLRDNEQYTSGVRTGTDFQAEVPEWSGPVVDGSSYFEEPMELVPAECPSLNGWNLNKPHTISNWLQCRELIYKDGNDTEGHVCGKWRRAPLSEVQTDEWDCSCAFVWDAIHADCAVPQELETDIIITHLKYVEKWWRSLLASKQKTGQTGNDDLNQPGNIGPD